jgi:hypothetical protein
MCDMMMMICLNTLVKTWRKFLRIFHDILNFINFNSILNPLNQINLNLFTNSSTTEALNPKYISIPAHLRERERERKSCHLNFMNSTRDTMRLEIIILCQSSNTPRDYKWILIVYNDFIYTHNKQFC